MVTPTSTDRQTSTARVATRPERVSRPMLLGEIAVVVLLLTLYDRIRDFATTRAGLAFTDARWVLDVERRLHIDVEGTLNRWLSVHWDVQLIASWYYQLAHLSVTMAVLVWLYVRRPEVYRGGRNALIAINALGLIVFWLRPVAPPRMLPGFIDSGLVSGVAQHAEQVSANVYAAMPSLHVGWAAWVVMQMWAAAASPRLKTVVAIHLGITVVVVLATANHFVLDAVAGLAVAVLAAVLVRAPMVARATQTSSDPGR